MRIRSDPEFGGRGTSRLAYTALGWVVLFFAFHVYWYLGGSFASPGKLPGRPHTLVGWIFDVLVTLAFPLGAWACLAIARGWARWQSATVAAVLGWLGTVLLVLRGGAGIVDDLTRMTGLSPTGITGLSDEQSTGVADPSSHLLWAGRAIDAYFLAGGIVFALLVVRGRGGGLFTRDRGSRRDRKCPNPPVDSDRSPAAEPFDSGVW